MFSSTRSFYAHASTAPPVEDPQQIIELYRRWRRSIFLSVILGYRGHKAGFVVRLFPTLSTIGTLSSEWLSDRFFGRRHTPKTLAAGILLVGAQLLLYYRPEGSSWFDRIAMGDAGFAIDDLLVFLRELTAMDITS